MSRPSVPLVGGRSGRTTLWRRTRRQDTHQRMNLLGGARPMRAALLLRRIHTTNAPDSRQQHVRSNAATMAMSSKHCAAVADIVYTENSTPTGSNHKQKGIRKKRKNRAEGPPSSVPEVAQRANSNAPSSASSDAVRASIARRRRAAPASCKGGPRAHPPSHSRAAVGRWERGPNTNVQSDKR